MEEISVEEVETEAAVEIARNSGRLYTQSVYFSLFVLQLLVFFPNGKVKCENFDAEFVFLGFDG